MVIRKRNDGLRKLSEVSLQEGGYCVDIRISARKAEEGVQQQTGRQAEKTAALDKDGTGDDDGLQTSLILKKNLLSSRNDDRSAILRDQTSTQAAPSLSGDRTLMWEFPLGTMRDSKCDQEIEMAGIRRSPSFRLLPSSPVKSSTQDMLHTQKVILP